MKREEKKQYTHQLLYETAMTLFREIGYEKATIDKIVQQAGVAKGSFFNYFKTKDEVLRYASDLQLKKVDRLVQTKLAIKDSAVHSIKQLFCELVSNIEWTRPLIFSMFQSNLSNPYNREKYIGNFAQTIKPLVVMGQQNGEITEAYSSDLLSIMAVQSYFSALFLWSSEGTGRTLVEEITVSMNLFFDGAAEK